MPRGARRRAACTAVALLLVFMVPDAFSGPTNGARRIERRRLGSSEGPTQRLGMGERNLNRARGSKTDAHVMRLGKRVVDVDAEIEAELAGRPPLVQGKAPGVPHRSLLEAGDLSGETDEMADVRWRLLDDAGDSRGDPSDSDAPRWGDGSGDAVTQFLVATDGARGAFEAVAAAVEAHGGGVAGVIPPASYVAMGGPAAAAAARDLPGTLWVGVLAPADVVTGGLDTADAAERTSLGEDGRALLEVSVPSLFVSDGGDVDSRDSPRRPRGAPRALAEAMASAFAATAAAASGDSGAWARPMAAWARDGLGVSGDRADAKVTRVLVGVRPEGLAATARALAAHRAAHLVAPRARMRAMRPMPSDRSLRPRRDAEDAMPSLSTRDLIKKTGRRLSNADSISGLQGEELAGTSTDTPFWDAGITGAGQVIGVGDTGADRANCYLNGADKFVLVRTIQGQDDVDEDGHGTHVCGSVAGHSSISGADADGAAYDAQIALTDFSNHTSGELLNFENMGDDFYEHAREVGARIHSDSWGSPSVYHRLYFGESAYVASSQEVDAYATDYLDFLPMFAVGNEGPSDTTYGMPANAKNALAIGATLSPDSSAVYSFDDSGRYCDESCADQSWAWFSFLPQLTGEFGYEGLGVYALDIGGPEAAHWAHLSGEIRAISADTWLSEPASGDHAFAAAVAIVADPYDACSALSNDVSGKVVIVTEEGSCYEADKTRRVVAAGGVAIVMVSSSYTNYWYFPSYYKGTFDYGGEEYDLMGFAPNGEYYGTPFTVPEDSEYYGEFSVSIPVLGIPLKDGQLLEAIVKDEPATTLSARLMDTTDTD